MSKEPAPSIPSSVTVAAVQMASGTDVSENLRAAGRLIEHAVDRGASLVALPENFAWLGGDAVSRQAVMETPGGGLVQAFLSDAARRWRIWLIGGTIPLRAPDGRAYAASLALDPDGQVAARYDKIHLFDVDLPEAKERYRESDYTCPGTEAKTVDTVCGRLGLTVCYDMRFPELYRRLAGAGALLFTVPSAFTMSTGAAHWEVLLRARAVENLAFVLAPAQGGRHPNERQTYGESMIVDPWGRVLARRHERGAGVVVAELDLLRQADIRRRFPVLRHCRLGSGGQ